MSAGERGVTLRDVAATTGLSVSAVSYALRGAANIPPETVERVRAAAEKLGYRPNARVGELMAHIRRAHPVARAEPLAFVFLDGTTGDPARMGFARQVEKAARVHAERRGYRLDSFSLADVENNARRMADILAARGIGGVLFAPTVTRGRLEVDWPWERFATAIVGMSELNVAPPRAGHHHYEAMREALTQLAKRGSRRPAAVFEGRTNERAHRGWQAAWLTFGPRGAAKRLWVQNDEPEAELEAWLKQNAPDGLVADATSTLRLALARVPTLTKERCATLSWNAGSGFAGIDQGYDEIATHAVDMVVTQLQRNERGLPEPPPMLLFPGRWREAE